MNPDELKEAYRYCESVTRANARSFYFANRFLPKEKKTAVYALYALCRNVDDEVDETEVRDDAAAARAVELWRARLNEVYRRAAHEGAAGGPDSGENEASAVPSDPDRKKVFLAWEDMLRRFSIPQEIPLDLMKGVLMDTRINRYESFEELYVYCYRVASTVGLMASEILGYSDAKALGHAESLGIAMQLTNILRDVGEDAEMDRVYLPLEDLRRFGVTTEQILGQEFDENFRELMRFQIGRAREYYALGEEGIPLLERDSRFCVLLASRIYGRILDEIENQDYDVFSSRAHTTGRQKLLSVPGIWREARNM